MMNHLDVIDAVGRFLGSNQRYHRRCHVLYVMDSTKIIQKWWVVGGRLGGVGVCFLFFGFWWLVDT